MFVEHGVPTSVDFNGCDPAHMVASFNSGDVVIYDLETSQNALVLKGQGEDSKLHTLTLTFNQNVLHSSSLLSLLLFSSQNFSSTLLSLFISFPSPSSSALPGSNHINKVVSHPTLPVTVTAHEDRHIKFFDNKSGLSATTRLCPLFSLSISPHLNRVSSPPCR